MTYILSNSLSLCILHYLTYFTAVQIWLRNMLNCMAKTNALFLSYKYIVTYCVASNTEVILFKQPVIIHSETEIT